MLYMFFETYLFCSAFRRQTLLLIVFAILGFAAPVAATASSGFRPGKLIQRFLFTEVYFFASVAASELKRSALFSDPVCHCPVDDAISRDILPPDGKTTPVVLLRAISLQFSFPARRSLSFITHFGVSFTQQNNFHVPALSDRGQLFFTKK